MRVRRIVADSQTPPPRGFPRWAWWTLFLATFTFVVPLTSPWWSTVLRGEIPGAEEEGDAPASGAAAGSTPEPVVPGSMLKVVLHTRLAGKPGLGTLEREVPYVRGVIPQIRAAVSELAVASAEAAALLPAGTRVLDVAYTQGGTVYIDFSPELDTGRGLGTEEETILIQGIVNTITDNFTAVRRVVILVDGKIPTPLHFDLSRPLRREEPFFESAEDAEPQASPSVAPTLPPGPAAAAPSSAPPAKPVATPAPAKPPSSSTQGQDPLS
ncbi:MAG: GerMN domain-containing protein [Vicinamibacteria bacterium]|nr:GerMN domain-containing protein [Vicinamibacteria bacterium]